MNKLLKRIIIALGIILIGIQFIRIDKGNPESNPVDDFITNMQPPAELAEIIKISCYDCHSNHTVYPWYTNIAPFSFWIKDHINNARHHLNFSEWTSYPPKKAHHKLDECYEMVEEGQMPLPSYLWIHHDAKLSADQRKALAIWFKSQMNNYDL